MRLNFVCRASKARKNGLSPIELSITIDGERTIITLDRYVKAAQFNPSTQKVRSDKDLNDYLEPIRKKCYAIENELVNRVLWIWVRLYPHISMVHQARKTLC